MTFFLNRAARRRALALARRDGATKMTRLMRVSQAGHYMARLFVSHPMGWSPGEAIERIQFGINTREIEYNPDASALRIERGAAYGPNLSREMCATLGGRDSDLQPKDFDALKAAGHDIKGWMLARAIIHLGSTMAEAKFTGRDPWDVLWDSMCNGNLYLGRLVHEYALVRRKFVSMTMVRLGMASLYVAFEEPGVWETTLAVAAALRIGENTGSELFDVAARHLQRLPTSALELLGLTQVQVRRDHNAPKAATYLLADVEDIHWSDMSGGRGHKAPKRFLYGYVWCNDLLDGDINHSCEHGDGPHRIKVCLLKHKNQDAWKEIGEEAAWTARQKSAT